MCINKCTHIHTRNGIALFGDEVDYIFIYIDAPYVQNDIPFIAYYMNWWYKMQCIKFKNATARLLLLYCRQG